MINVNKARNAGHFWGDQLKTESAYLRAPLIIGQVYSLISALMHSGLPDWAGVVQARMGGDQTTPVEHLPAVARPFTQSTYSLHLSGSGGLKYPFLRGHPGNTSGSCSNVLFLHSTLCGWLQDLPGMSYTNPSGHSFSVSLPLVPHSWNLSHWMGSSTVYLPNWIKDLKSQNTLCHSNLRCALHALKVNKVSTILQILYLQKFLKL